MLTLCQTESLEAFTALTLLQCYHPGLLLLKHFGGKNSDRLLILHGVTLNKDTYSLGFSVTSKSIALSCIGEMRLNSVFQNGKCVMNTEL